MDAHPASTTRAVLRGFVFACVIAGVAWPASAAPSRDKGRACAQTFKETAGVAQHEHAVGKAVHITGTGYAPNCGLDVEVTAPDGAVAREPAWSDGDGRLAYDHALGAASAFHRVRVLARDGTLLAATGFASAAACELTVDPARPDTGSNFWTIQAAVDALPNPGPCVVTVAAGTYRERVNIVSKNSLALSDTQRIVIRAETPGSVTVDPSQAKGLAVTCGGQRNDAHGFCIGSRSADTITAFVTIMGFEVTGATRDGIAFFTSSGSTYAATDVAIDGNHIHGNGAGGFSGISVGAGTVRTWIVNNLLRSNTRHGVWLNAAAGQTYIVNNTFFGNGWSGVTRTGSAPAALVNNLFVNNGTTAGGTGNCSCGLGQTGQGTAASITLVGNMLYRNGAGMSPASGLQYVNDIAAPGSVLNAVAGRADAENYTTTGHANRTSSATTGIEACAFGDCASSHSVNEIFLNTSLPVEDFRLQMEWPMSPAIDAGVASYVDDGMEWVPSSANPWNMAPQDDFWGTVRPQDGNSDGTAAVDIGYHEAMPRFMDALYHWCRPWVNNLVKWGITAGCAPYQYCPDAPLTRAQIAIFLLRSMNGAGYVPPPATGVVFSDVPADAFAAAWIEQLAFLGITEGCASEPRMYCPDQPIIRDDMAVFLLRARHGGAYEPPPATGTVFLDVPATLPLADWIEELSAEGITAGCGWGNYCPDWSVTRGQIAVFLTRTFDLW
jgi:hypothetical protein